MYVCMYIYGLTIHFKVIGKKVRVTSSFSILSVVCIICNVMKLCFNARVCVFFIKAKDSCCGFHMK